MVAMANDFPLYCNLLPLFCGVNCAAGSQRCEMVVRKVSSIQVLVIQEANALACFVLILLRAPFKADTSAITGMAKGSISSAIPAAGKFSGSSLTKNHTMAPQFCVAINNGKPHPHHHRGRSGLSLSFHRIEVSPDRLRRHAEERLNRRVRNWQMFADWFGIVSGLKIRHSPDQ